MIAPDLSSAAQQVPAIVLENPVCMLPNSTQMPAAFANLSFTLGQQELLCISGVNGCGKSTLLCLLAGIYPCTQGRYELLGKQISPVADGKQAQNEVSQWLSQKTALVMQDADMQLLGATVAEDLHISLAQLAGGATRQSAASRTPENAANDAAWMLAQRLSLAADWHTPPHSMSYGQKRKVCIAAAMLRQPAILLLDEPFSGLDYPALKELRLLLRQAKQEGTTLVITTHDIEPILDFTDKVLLLSPERTPLFGTPNIVLPHAETMSVRPPLKRDFP